MGGWWWPCCTQFRVGKSRPTICCCICTRYGKWAGSLSLSLSLPGSAIRAGPMLEDAGGGKAKRGSIERDDTRSVRVANIDPALTTTMHHNGQQQPLVSSTSFPHLASTSSSFLSFYFFVFFSFIDFLLSFLVSFPLVPLVNSLVSSAPLVRRRGIGRFASSPFVCRRDDVCRPLPPPYPLD